MQTRSVVSKLLKKPSFGASRALHTSRAASISFVEKFFNVGDIFKYDLYRPPPYAPEPIFEASAEPTAVNVNELPNGVRVASQDLGGQVSAIAIFIDASPRYETGETAGSSYLLEKLAFKGSAKRSKARLIREMEDLTASFTCTASRETMASCAEGLRYRVPEMFGYLAEATVTPRVMAKSITKETLNLELMSTINMLKKQMSSDENDLSDEVTEMLHGTAYGGCSLGMPLKPSVSRLDHITLSSLQDYISSLYTGSNIVVSGCNVNHRELVSLSREYLGYLPKGEKNLAGHHAKYTGGSGRIESEDAMSHVSIAFEGYPWDSKEIVPQCVLHTLMGGGGSFSSGGPGKGLFTRLYSDVLHRYHWLYSMAAVNHVYPDTSLFGIEGSAGKDKLNSLRKAVLSATKLIAKPLSDEELLRAQNQAKSSCLMNMESRVLVCEDIGRQLLNCGKYITPQEFLTRIDATTAKDIEDVGRKLLSSKPTLVLKGQSYNDINYATVLDDVSKTMKEIGL